MQPSCWFPYNSKDQGGDKIDGISDSRLVDKDEVGKCHEKKASLFKLKQKCDSLNENNFVNDCNVFHVDTGALRGKLKECKNVNTHWLSSAIAAK